MAIVESTTIDGPARPCVCENSLPPDATALVDGGLKPILEAPSAAAAAAALACSPPDARTFTPRKMTVSYIGLNIPYLRLRGRWLDRAGFGVGTHVRVEVSERRLIVEAVQPEDLRCAEPNCPHEAKRRRQERRAGRYQRCNGREPGDV